MPAFEIVADAGDTANVFEGTVSSITASDGDLLERDAGSTAWTVATAATDNWQEIAICQGAITTSLTLVPLIQVTPFMKIRATSTNDSSADDNGDRMILSSKSAVNNTGSNDTSEKSVFIQDAPSGATGDKKILGHFVLGGAGVDPDAS